MVPRNLREIVINTLREAAPERSREISDYLARYNPSFDLEDTGSSRNINATRHRIAIDVSAADAIWLYSFAMWRSIETYGVIVDMAIGGKLTIDQAIQKDASLGQFEFNFKAGIAAANDLVTPATHATFQWPHDIPHPTVNRSMLDNQGKVAWDICAFAFAAFCLHEMKHFSYASDGDRPGDFAEEEVHCDEFARSFLLDKCAEYARTSGNDYDKVLKIRSYGLLIAAAAIHELTPQFERFGNAQYPSVGFRIQTLIGNMPLMDNDNFWLFVGSLMTGIARKNGQQISFVPTDRRSYAEYLINQMV